MNTTHKKHKTPKVNTPTYKKQLKIIDVISNLFAISLFSVFPLVVYKDYTNITQAKLTTFLILLFGFSSVIIFVFGGIFLDGYRPVKNSLNVNLSFYFLGAYLIFAVISILMSPELTLKNDIGRSAFLFGSGRHDGFLLLLCYVLTFIVLSCFGQFSKAHIFVISTTLTVMSVIGIIQTFGINIFHLYPEKSYNGKLDNFISTVGNFDFFSGIVCIFIPIVIFSAILIDFALYERILLLLSGVLGLYILFALNVSSGKLAIIVTLSVSIPFLIAIKGNKFIKIGVSVFLIELLMLMGVLFFIYSKIPVNTDVTAINRDFLTEISNILHGEIDETTGTYRIGIWLNAFKMWAGHPLFGTGMGSFMKTFSEYTNRELLAFSGGKIDTCHNEYLQILCVGGIVGLISYLGFIGSIIGNAVKYCRENKYITVLLFSTICYLIQAFFSFSIVITAPVIWAVFGLLNNLSRRTQNEKNL